MEILFKLSVLIKAVTNNLSTYVRNYLSSYVITANVNVIQTIHNASNNLSKISSKESHQKFIQIINLKRNFKIGEEFDKIID
jgi:hypothetical protein